MHLRAPLLALQLDLPPDRLAKLKPVQLGSSEDLLVGQRWVQPAGPAAPPRPATHALDCLPACLQSVCDRWVAGQCCVMCLQPTASSWCRQPVWVRPCYEPGEPGWLLDGCRGVHEAGELIACLQGIVSGVGRELNTGLVTIKNVIQTDGEVPACLSCSASLVTCLSCTCSGHQPWQLWRSPAGQPGPCSGHQHCDCRPFWQGAESSPGALIDYHSCCCQSRC
jgi:hypothetical protein